MEEGNEKKRQDNGQETRDRNDDTDKGVKRGTVYEHLEQVGARALEIGGELRKVIDKAIKGIVEVRTKRGNEGTALEDNRAKARKQNCNLTGQPRKETDGTPEERKQKRENGEHGITS